MGIWRFDQNPKTTICIKLEAQDEVSRDKEGLFETPNALIKNNGYGFWNVLIEKK
jgi:hypothetical protein